MNSSSHLAPSPANREFDTTQWSLVLSAGERQDATAEAALAVLCERYWYPLYAFVRRRGYDAHQAQDLTQAFFVRLLEKNTLAAASPEQGRFRSFLLTALKHFLANEWDREHTQKRGGDRQRLALDYAAGESRWSFEPADLLTPERLFERQWALTLLDTVIARLQDELVQAGKGRQFELLKGTLLGERAAGAYTAAAAELHMSEEAVRQAAHRLRKRFRELLRAEVAQTVAGPGEVDEEIQSLFAALET
jgi:RNA polymerase sigma-70 factor (ECF subfamily)